jgi:hypothetical protein
MTKIYFFGTYFFFGFLVFDLKHPMNVFLDSLPAFSDFKPTNTALVLPWDLYSMGFSAVLWGLLYTIIQMVLIPLSNAFFPYSKSTTKSKVNNTRLKFRIAGWKFTTYALMAVETYLIVGTWLVHTSFRVLGS